MLDDFVFGVGDLIHQPPLKWRDPRPLIWSSDSNSPKRTHIFGRAKLSSQTLVVICLFDLIVEESNVNAPPRTHFIELYQSFDIFLRLIFGDSIS